MHFYLRHRRLRATGLSGRGFTLIEILVAVTIFAFMMTALFYAFNLLSEGVDTVDEGVAVYSQARSCFDRLTTDLRSVYVAPPAAYAPPDLSDEPDPYRFLCDNPYGDGGQLRFVSFSHLRLGSQLQASVGRIMYYLHKTQDGQTVLMRRDEMIHTEEDPASGGDPVVCEDVRSFSVVCFDAEGVEYEYWDSDKKEFDYATPRAVQVILVVGDNDQSDRTYRFETAVALPAYREKVGDV